MPKIKHVDGTVAEVDDELAKKLFEDGSNIWSAVEEKRERAHRTRAAKDADKE